MSAFRNCARAFVLASVFTLVVGCGSPTRIPEPRIDSPPLPFVVSLSIPEDRTDRSTEIGGEGDDSRLELPVDRQAIGRRLEEWCGRAVPCTRVEVRQEAPESAIASARQSGADLLVIVRELDRPRYEFAARSGWFLPNTVLWFFLGFPSFWVRDRIYSLRWDIDFEVYSVPSGERLYVIRESLEESVPLHLADRGWTAPALWTPPGFYEGPDTSRALVPFIEDRLVERLIRFVQQEPTRSGEIGIDVFAPASGDTPVFRAKVSSARPLEAAQLTLAGETVWSRNVLTMPSGERAGERWIYNLAVPIAPESAGLLRFFVRQASRNPEADPVPIGTKARWDASRTLRYPSQVMK
ncbi:MAG: hypothetical protein AAF517_17685 [Planctomycetota bacterium]